jgi:hypothetical protein
MAEPIGPTVHGQHCFLQTLPLQRTKALAEQYACDIGIPNDAGIGNVLVYTRLVEDLARLRGRQIDILTGPLDTPLPLIYDDDGLAIWRRNPYIRKIVNAQDVSAEIMPAINAERDNIVQFGHMIENIEYHYGLRPTILRPSIYLDESECTWALETLEPLPRPIIAVHPYSSSGSPPGHYWYRDGWREIIEGGRDFGSWVEVRNFDGQDKQLGLFSIRTTLRQMFALIWASDIIVCLDSAISHVATAFEKPAIILWDPTLKVTIEEKWQAGFALAALSRWSYPQNDNVMLLSSRQDDVVKIILSLLRKRVQARVF